MFDTICLSGGGIKGFSFIGALEYLEDQKFINLKSINNWIGTSAGAITCFLFTLNYTSEEIRNFILDFNFKKLVPEIKIDNLLDFYGIDCGTKLVFTISEFLKEKVNLPDLTFEQHYKITNKKLTIIGTNFSKNSEAVFNYENTPKMSVLTAIRISSSIPIIFTPVIYESDYYVDGALINNFPINYCNLDTTFGIYIKNNCYNKLDNIITLIQGCISIVANTISQKHFTDNTLNILEINNNLIDIVNFNLDKNAKLQLLKLGSDAAQMYLNDLPKKIAKNTINNIIKKVLNKLVIN